MRSRSQSCDSDFFEVRDIVLSMDSEHASVVTKAATVISERLAVQLVAMDAFYTGMNIATIITW